MNKYEKALTNNLDNLVDAFHLVLNAIEEGDNNTKDCYSELISEGYPFKESFDELFLKVMDWRDTIKDLIKNKDINNINKAKEICNDINRRLKLIDGCVCMYYILDTTEKYCYALVFNIENTEEFGVNILGKVARQPINSLLQCDYDFDWEFPVYKNCYDIDNDEIGLEDSWSEISVKTWEDVFDLLEHYCKFKEYYFKYE